MLTRKPLPPAVPTAQRRQRWAVGRETADRHWAKAHATPPPPPPPPPAMPSVAVYAERWSPSQSSPICASWEDQPFASPLASPAAAVSSPKALSIHPAWCERHDGDPPSWEVAWRVSMSLDERSEDAPLIERTIEEGARRAVAMGMEEQKVKRMLGQLESERDGCLSAGGAGEATDALRSMFAFSRVCDTSPMFLAPFTPPSPGTALAGEMMRRAAIAGDAAELQRLLNAGEGLSANRYVEATTILMFAAMHGHKDCVEMLVKHGCGPCQVAYRRATSAIHHLSAVNTAGNACSQRWRGSSRERSSPVYGWVDSVSFCG